MGNCLCGRAIEESGVTDPRPTEGEPTFYEMIRLIVSREMEKNHGALPVEVVSYNSARQSVDAVPLIRVVIKGEARELATMRDVPVRWPSSANHSITFPLAKNDTGFVNPCGGDLGKWLASGTKRSADVEHRRFDLSDAYFEPGGRTFVNALSAALIDAAWGVLGGQWKVGGSAASSFVALATLVNAELDAIETALLTHTHTGVTAGPGITGTSNSAYTQSDVDATKLKSL
jgi:hypothetical protein